MQNKYENEGVKRQKTKRVCRESGNEHRKNTFMGIQTKHCNSNMISNKSMIICFPISGSDLVQGITLAIKIQSHYTFH